jgi:methyl-accepting chemotaxis protein
MVRVDQVTQQTASAAEELSSTAEEMSAQAQSLRRLIGFFQLESETAIEADAADSSEEPPAESGVDDRGARIEASDRAGRPLKSGGDGVEPGFGRF